MWNPLRYFQGGLVSDEEFLRQKAELLSHAPIPCLWLFGKTGSGKTSIVRYLTGAADAVIGSGYRPQTQHSRLFSFPDDDLPIVRFLDTRGLGEAHYDPTADLAQFNESAHLVIVTVRATDQAMEEVHRPLREIRRANPKRPTLLVVTCLHDAYPGQQHPNPDPFGSELRPLPTSIPEDLRRCLAAHYQRFDGLFDRAVPIDLTPADEGFTEPDFGGQRLKQAILDLLPTAYRQTLLQMEQLREILGEMHQRRSTPVILAHSALAASAAAVPVPWVDLPVVMAIQSHLAHRLAKLNHQRLDAATFAQVSLAVGGGVAVRMGLREVLKFIPWVGMAANAAAAFAFTYASGWSWNWYFLQVKQGHIPTADELRQVYQQQLETGARLWRTTHTEPKS
ncbi:MAG: GTPase [Planctomycetaceae bacterium]